MAIVEATQLRMQRTIAELNHRIANGEIRTLRVFNGDFLVLSMRPQDFGQINLAVCTSFLSISSATPYVHMMFSFTYLSHIEVL